MTGFADDSLISDFVVETREHLDAIEPDLLAMEQEGATVSQEIVNRVFRAIHSTKGGAGFLSFSKLKLLSHAMESVLMLVRDGEMLVSAELMDVLLAGVDKLRAMVDDIQASEQVEIEEDLQRLNTILEQEGVNKDAQVTGQTMAAEAGEEEKGVRMFDLNAQEVRNALNRGMFIYEATVYIHRDLQDRGFTPLEFLDNVESLGICLEARFDLEGSADLEGCLEQDLAFTFLFATVLEEDLVAAGLELPEEQIVALDRDKLKEKLFGTEKPEAPEVPEAPAAEAPPLEEGEVKAEVSKGGGEVAETLRVRVDLLTRLMNMAGELVLGRNQLLRCLEEHSSAIPGLPGILQNVDLVTTELQEGIMQTRMQPVGTVFGRFTRVVRDMARKLGKEIQLDVEGSEVELDKSIIELLSDPLTHIIRNCADHALEPPDERVKQGKSRTGRILLQAFHEGGQVNIAVTDDGRGIDAKKILKKAIEKGVVSESEGAAMGEREIINLVFAPGFSTAEVVSEVSGRGVGMDVVRTNIEKLGGTIDVETALNQGTMVLLRLPLTLAIIPSLVVGVGGHRFAVPQVNLVELVWVRAAEVKDRIERVHGAAVLRLRGRLLPLVHLRQVLDIGTRSTRLEEGGEERRQNIADRRSAEAEQISVAEPEKRCERSGSDRRLDWHGDYNILVLQVGSNQFGLIVDELFDSEEIVVKPLSGAIKECRTFAGATILGDGRVIMIVDAAGIANVAELQFSDVDAEERRREEEAREAAQAAATRRSVIFFTSASNEYFAVPQEKVLRLERIIPSSIEMVGNREFIQYRGSGLPLVRLNDYLPVKPLPEETKELFLVIPKFVREGVVTEATAGILVSSIIDAMDVSVQLEQSSVDGPGLQGSAIVLEKLTLFVDPCELVTGAGVIGSAV